MTSHDWAEVRLGDSISVSHGWPFKGAEFCDPVNGLPIVINIGNFQYTGGFRFDSTTVRAYSGEYPREYELKPNEILLVMTCQTQGGEILGIPGRVPDDGRLYLHNQRLGRIGFRPEAQLDPEFAYWLFRSHQFNSALYRTASGSKIMHTSPSRIEDVRMSLPSFEEQRRIAFVLSTLDDKIDSNRRLATLLEETAAAIFKARFVDFVGVEEFEEHDTVRVPKGWQVGSIYELADVTYGRPFKSSLFNDTEGTPLIRIRDLPANRPSVVTPEVRTDARMIGRGDIVVGMDGEFRAYVWSGPDSWLNQRVCVFDPRDGISPTFVLESIKRPLAFFEATKGGTTVIHLGKRDIDSFVVPVPPSHVMRDFGEIADPMVELATNLKWESRGLAGLRDALLPKLISGEIRVPDTADPEEVIGPAAEQLVGVGT